MVAGFRCEMNDYRRKKVFNETFMGYIDRRKIQGLTEDSLTSDQKKNIESARSFFDGKMADLERSFEGGAVKREELGQKIADLLKSFKVFLSTTEVEKLQKKIDRI